MLGFVLGVSITLNVIGIIAIIIYLSVKNKVVNKFNSKFVNSLESEEIDNKEDVKDFMKNDDIDFSSMWR